jgi:CTP synthase (UTP-ammonia lyase)
VIGVIADYNPANRTHTATDEALSSLPHATPFEWIGTDDPNLPERLHDLSGVFIGPASPYRNMEAAIEAVRFARERGVPLVGT